MKLTHSASAWAARLGMVGLAFVTPLGAQNLVTNPGFETGDFSGWTQAGSTIFTTVTSGGCPFIPAITAQHAGIYGTCLGPNDANGYLLQQLLTTQAGHTYDIGFWVQHQSGAAAPDAIFNAYWGDLPIYSSVGGYFDYAHQSALAIALFPGTQLRFEFKEVPSYWNLDDISVVDLGVVPEPTSIVLLGTGLVGLAGLIRRRRSTL